MKLLVKVKGSGKSGNYGHSGRPGKRGGSSPSIITNISESDFESAWEEVQQWDNSSGKRVAIRALADFEPRRKGQAPYSGIILREQGKIVGVGSHSITGNKLKINNIGTQTGKGFGRQLFARYVQLAKDQNKTLRAEATVGARSFYEKMGMGLVEGTANIYEL